ncbi:hypothetical protein LZ31DRAFT_593293 [Colletotrichum somersetense]|nr:hypothetical protein LZ31DRAFT_593293 [Colletotrichum somersetense]
MGTTGAGDPASAITHAIGAGGPSEKRQGRRPACVECRRRKIKCDRNYPCVSCIALDHECRQPPPGPARRPRRRNHHELYDKIARMESLLERYAVPLEHRKAQSLLSDLHPDMLSFGEPDSLQQPAALAHPRTQQPRGTLARVWNGGLEFRDSKAMAVVFDDTIRALIDVELEQEAWLPLVDAPGERRQSYDTSIPFMDQMSVCVPPAHAIDVLWRVFLDRVDPVTKVIHVPTFHVRVIEAMNNFAGVPLATIALLFSVFLTASGSLSRQEHWDELGRIVPADAKRLIRPVDPKCEMRRRLWWQIVILETRSGGAFGTGSHLLPSCRDTRIPLNINDEDLSPTMQTEPWSHDGPTEMSFCIVTYEIDDILWRQLPSPTNPYEGPSMESLEVITALERFSDVIDGILRPLESKLCPDPGTNPLHAMAHCTRESLCRIIQVLVTPMEEAPKWGTEVLGPDDNFFRVGLAANEEAVQARKAAGRRFAWYADIDFKMQGFYYLGAQLQSRPAGSMAHRVWSVMEDTYALHEELWELRDKENMTLCNLLLSAWDKRSVHLATRHVLLPEPPFLSRLRDKVMAMKAEALGML